MSFEVFVQCFEGGEPAGMDRKAIRALFPVVEAASERNHWKVRYNRKNESEIYLAPLASKAAQVKGFTVSRPCADIRLWEALLAILKGHPAVLYFPGDGPLVAHRETCRQMPPDMVEALGRPKVVKTAKDILAAVAAE